MTPPSPLYGWVECFALGFSRNGLGFVLESDRDGVFFGFLSSDGVVFTCGCMTPPSPFFGGVLGFLFVGGVVDSLNSDIFSYFFVLLCTFFYLSRPWVCGGGSKASGSYLHGLVLRGFEPPRACKSLRC